MRVNTFRVNGDLVTFVVGSDDDRIITGSLYLKLVPYELVTNRNHKV